MKDLDEEFKGSKINNVENVDVKRKNILNKEEKIEGKL